MQQEKLSTGNNRAACIVGGMSDIGARLKSARNAKGMTLAALAKSSGLTYQTLQDLEKGKSKGTKHILKLAKALETTPEWLEAEQGPRTAPKPVPAPQHMPNPHPAHERLPVLGMAECGPDGWSMWNGDVIETIPRPANLANVSNAYAVYITGDSMVPRYNPGELAHIHPGKPVTIGAYVLVQKKPKAAGEVPQAVIKQLTKRSGNRIVLTQLNPPKTFEMKLDETVSMHRVVGSGEA